MGVLDEAIREHLELKRRHGADPEDVARAEREALGPAVRDRGATAPAAEVAIGEPDRSAVETPADASELISALEPTEAVPTEPELAPVEEPELASPAEPELAPVEEPELASAAEPEVPLPPATPLQAGDISPTLRADAPPRPSQAQPPPPPAEEPPVDQPTEVFDADEIFAEEEDAPSSPSESKEAEDVLEETPEFLQETPEHDRLWFEQKPPRDFDFDG